ncbi:MAG: transposase [Bacteroidetes bacterium]|nr:MAG: transposase [Bacteroidota bacterium]
MRTQKKEILSPIRVFSVKVKRTVVKDIEDGKCSVLQASRELGVSKQTIYKWVYKFSRHLQKNRIMVVEDQSEAYRSSELEKRIKELEAALGRKSLELDYYKILMEVAEEELKIDLKKNFGQKASKDSGPKKE